MERENCVKKPLQKIFYQKKTQSLHMGRIRKSPSVTLILITVFTSLMLIGSVSSQSIPKPSVPTFTLTFQDNSYTILPRIMRTTDPYTGVQTRSNTAPIYVQNKTIQVTITNQPFAPYTDSNGNTIGLVYDVRYKGHYSSTWWSLSPHVYFNQSNSATTEIPVAFAGNYDQTGGIASLNGNPTPDVKIDFQVQALTGHIELLNGLYNFTGESSGWSSTKTITTIRNSNLSFTNLNSKRFFSNSYHLPNFNSCRSRVFLVDDSTLLPFNTLYCSPN